MSTEHFPKSSRPAKKRLVETNLKVIAAELGVSRMTVSRALSGHPRVASATRDRILAVAERLRYRPNRLVHAIQSGRSRTVGVMIGITSSFQGRLIHGIHDTLAKTSTLPILHFHGDGPTADRDQEELVFLHRLLDQRVDGIIFWPSDETVPEHYLHEVWERGVPLVAIDRNLPRTKADFAGTDDIKGGRLVAEHLLGLGHRRLAHIGGEPWVSTYADRRRGFEEAIRAAKGVTYAVEDCKDGRCREIARRMLDSPDPPTAIFVATDWHAPPVYLAAEERGLQVGKDLAVVGYGDLSEISWLRPHLTTVDQKPEEIGRAAARMLMDRLDGTTTSAAAQGVRITPELVIRESTRGPRA